MTVHRIEARTHGRYLVDRPAGDGPFPIIAGFHGYAENAEHMLQQLVRIRENRNWLLVSIQALNRFYSRSRVTTEPASIVANWMTREDRELAIADNLAYVAAVVAAVRAEYPTTHTLVYAGFSQGVAMAYRAAASGPSATGVIALAGDVPPDVVPRAAALPPILIGRGRSDDWYTEAKASSDIEVLHRAGTRFTTHVFDAGHVWDDSFIARAREFLRTLEADG